MNIPTESMDIEGDTPSILPLHQVDFRPIDSSALTAHEAVERYQCVLELEKHIKRTNKQFQLRLDHVAAILLAVPQQLKKGGRLWAGPSCRVPPYLMERRLNAIPPLCRHYMLHLDPKNLVLPIWRHAVPMPLKPQPDPCDVPWDDGVEAYEKAMAYHSRFETGSDLPSIPLDEQQMEEAKCRERNEDKCVVTGRSKPRVFWIIPSTWNDTVDHMNATGDLHSACLALVGIDLLDDPNFPQGPDLLEESSPPVSVKKLGTTHKSWNMMCIDPVLYRYLNGGWCAFKYLFHRDDNNDNVKVTLEFHWMPKLLPLFGEPIEDINEFWTPFSEQMGQFDNCLPPPGLEHGKIRDKSGELLKSGYRFDVLVPKQHVARFQSGIGVLWACVRFTALCGAAGRPWLLSGKDPEDASMRERQKNAVSQDNQKLRWWSKTFGKLKDTGKQVGDTIIDRLTREALSDLLSAARDSTTSRGPGDSDII